MPPPYLSTLYILSLDMRWRHVLHSSWELLAAADASDAECFTHVTAALEHQDALFLADSCLPGDQVQLEAAGPYARRRCTRTS